MILKNKRIGLTESKTGKSKRGFAILSLSIAFVLSITMMGCSNNSTGSDMSSQKNAASEASSPNEEITFVLDWTPNTNHTGLYVALAQGYFAEQGLDVHIVQPPDNGAEALVASGRAQFGVSFQDSMAPALAGENKMPITAVAAIMQHNTSGIVSRAGEGIDHPAGLEGHTYATWDLPVEKATIKQVMEADSGDFSKVEFVPSTVTDEVSALQSKSVDAIWIFRGWAGVACDVAGLDTDYFSFADIDPVFDYYTPVVIANDEYLAQHPETAKKILAALAKGYEYAIEDPDGAAAILMEEVKELSGSEELIVASQRYLADQYKAEASKWGEIDPDRWRNFYEWLNENNLIEGELDPNAGYSNEYL